MSVEYADVVLAEYKELKGEQRQRIGGRDGLVYTALALVFVAARILGIEQTPEG